RCWTQRRSGGSLPGSSVGSGRHRGLIQGRAGRWRPPTGLADPVVEILPALVEPGDQLVALARHRRRREAPEPELDRRADQPTRPDVADVLEAVEADVAEDHDV